MRAHAPVQLGCCREPDRCLLCPPPPPIPSPDTVAALVEHVQERRPDAEVFAAFYGGAPPDDDLLDAVGDVPFLVRVRPDLLTRAEAARLVGRGVVAVELDLLSFDDRVLREVRRRHRTAAVLEMARWLRSRVELGVVLAQGLPASTHASCVADARVARDLAHTARLHPALVLHRSGLKRAHMDGLYTPLTLGEAITTCRAVMDVLEPDVRVIRVGQQAGPDGLGRAVAGPRHPSLRELVESRRALERARVALRGTLPGATVVLRCAPADTPRVLGPRKQHVRDLRAEFRLQELQIQSDAAMNRGELTVERFG